MDARKIYSLCPLHPMYYYWYCKILLLLAVISMSFPGMAPQAGAGGLSEQEQKYVRMV